MNLSFTTFLLASFPASSVAKATGVTDENFHAEFFTWANQHFKTYKSEEETRLRLEIWKNNDGMCKNETMEYLCGIVSDGQKSFMPKLFVVLCISYDCRPYFRETFFFFTLFVAPAFIQAHNSKIPSPSYLLGHNHFSDLTVDEYQELNKLGNYSPGLMTPFRSRSSESLGSATKLRKKRRLQDVPDSLDWVEKGAIVPVKNQGEK